MWFNGKQTLVFVGYLSFRLLLNVKAYVCRTEITFYKKNQMHNGKIPKTLP
jgi:hypothetical protein